MATQVSELDVLVKGRDELSPTLSQLESRVIRWVGAISASIAAIKIAGAPITATAQFERELANVTKTTNFTKSEINELSKALLDMSTRIDIGTVDLVKIAAAAGQQGLGKFGVEGVVAFTDSVSRMASVLDISAEDAATNIGKLINVFKIPIKEVEKVVSTFNQVSNNSTAKGEELLDVVKRIGDAAGSLKLEDAVALAATALDFGVNPEVAGTAYSKMFASMREQASEFARLMKTDTKSWLTLVEKDGFNAYKRVLDAFRKLNTEDQQKAITKLFGGGRISALVNKNVQDTQNVVLDRNFAQALKGLEGNSAIKEQQTVLQTLVAQSKAALNSLFKLGVETGEQALVPLTQYVAQLNTALQSDGLKSFLQAAAKAVLQLVEHVANAVKFVASLNVNWENFIGLAKLFLGLKLAEYLAGSLGKSLLGFGDRLKYIATGVSATTEAAKKTQAANAAVTASQAAADQAFKTSIASRILGYEELELKVKAYLAARANEVAAEAAVGTAAKAAADARTAAAISGGKNTAATSQLQTIATATQAQRAAVLAAEQQAADLQTQIAQTRAARMAQVETESNARRLAIAEDYKVKKQQIDATGTQVGLTALKRERDAALALEEASYQRSLRGIQSYYTRRAAVVAEGSAQEIAIERAKHMNRLAEFDGAVQKQGKAALGAQGGADQLATTEEALKKATGRLALMRQELAAAGSAWMKFGILARAAAGVIAAAGRIIMSGLVWITVIYSLADAFGLLDGMSKWWREFSDSVGLTSEATRKAAVEAEKRKQKLEEEKKALQDLIDKYAEFTNAATGQIDRKEIGRLSQMVLSEDSATQQQALASMDEMARALAAKQKQVQEQISTGNTANIEAEKKKILNFTEEIRKLMESQGKVELKFGPTGEVLGQETTDNTAKIKELYKAIGEANKNIQDFSKNTGVMKEVLKGNLDSAQDLTKAVASMFTPQTLAFAQEHVSKLADLSQAANIAKGEMDAAVQAAKGGGDGTAAVADAAKVKYQNLSAEVATTRANILEMIKAQMQVGGLSPETLNSWNNLLIIVDSAANVMKGIVGVASAAPVAALTGKGANTGKKTESSGSGTFKPIDKGGESRARREAKARLELRRANLQAEQKLQEELSKQALDAETRFYDRGLKSFTEYYDKRRAVLLEANQFDINSKRLEVEAAEEEVKNAKQKSDKDKFEATAVRLRGEISVLEAQRKAIVDQNDEEERRAKESFADQIRQQTNELMQQGFILPGADEGFKSSLDELLATHRVALAQMRSNSQEALADIWEKSFKAEALQRVLDPIMSDFRRAQDQIGMFQQRLNLAVGQGAISATEMEVAYSQAIDAQTQTLQGFIDKQAELIRQNEAIRGSRTYQNMVDDIERARIALAELRQEQSKMAIDFNNQTRDSLSQFLGTMEPTFTSLREGFIGFLLSITQNIQKTLGNSIADAIMQSLGQTGTGGIGGFIQNLVKGPGSLAAKGLTERGSSFAFPMYVVSKDGLTDGLADWMKNGGSDGSLGNLGESLISNDQLGELTSGIGSAVASPMEALSGDLGGLFGGLTETLSSLFTSLLSSLGGSSGGGLFAAIGSLFGAAHKGGIAGKPTMFRRVSPLVFRDALRYHKGGVAGLKPGEVPTILEEGERIRTKKQEAALQEQLAAGGGGGGVSQIGIRNVLVVDPNFVPSAMQSAEGDMVTTSYLKRNAASVRSILGIKS